MSDLSMSIHSAPYFSDIRALIRFRRVVKGLERSIKGCAHGSVPDIETDGVLVIFARLRKVFGQSNRREGGL